MGYETRLADGLRAKRKPQEGEKTVGEVGTFGPSTKLVGYTHDQPILSYFDPEYRGVVLHLLSRD